MKWRSRWPWELLDGFLCLPPGQPYSQSKKAIKKKLHFCVFYFCPMFKMFRKEEKSFHRGDFYRSSRGFPCHTLAPPNKKPTAVLAQEFCSSICSSFDLFACKINARHEPTSNFYFDAQFLNKQISQFLTFQTISLTNECIIRIPEDSAGNLVTCAKIYDKKRNQFFLTTVLLAYYF